MMYSLPSTRFHESVCAGQHSVNKSIFNDKDNIFLNKGKESNLQVVFPFSKGPQKQCQKPRWHDDKSDQSSLALLEAYSRESILKTAEAVNTFFATRRESLTILHVDKRQSYARINMTREVFDQLSKSASIFSALKDTILYFGYRSFEVEIAPPRPRIDFLFNNADRTTPSGFEIAYGLRYIELNDRQENEAWSLRQCVVYNKTRHHTPESNWVFMTTPASFRAELEGHLIDCGDQLASHPFHIHVLLISAVLPTWRPYLVDVQKEVEGHKLPILASDPDRSSDSSLGGTTLQTMKDLEDAVLNAMLAMSATKDVIETLMELHQTSLSFKNHTTSTQSIEGMDSISFTLTERYRDVKALLGQTETLILKIKSISDAASSILSLQSGNALKELLSQARDEGKDMSKLTRIAARDAKSVKALGVITVIFLPITVVLNFFSASFIDVSKGSLEVVGRWWIFLAVGVPLTLVTLTAWLLWTSRTPRDLLTPEQVREPPRSRTFWRRSTNNTDDAEKGLSLASSPLSPISDSWTPIKHKGKI